MKKYLISLILVLCAITVVGYGYEDIPDNAWYKNDAYILYDAGYMVGDEQNNFNPYKSITLKEFSTVLLRGHSFIMETDVYEASLYLSELYHLVDAGEYTEETWLNNITRIEAAKIMYNFVSSSLIDINNINENIIVSKWIKDYNDITEEDRVYAEWAVKHGVMVGDNNRNFNPNSELTRAEAAAVIVRLIDNDNVKNLKVQEFDTLISSFETYTTKDRNRNFNIAKAAGSVNGTILQPGEQFSYYKTIGNPGKKQGYVESTVIANGKYVTGFGGGVCQNATTLFNAVLKANLQIDERRAHGLKSTYVDPGYDATFASGSIDFKFTNTLDKPILIEMVFDETTRKLSVGIYSDYTVEIPEVKIYTTGKGNSWTLYREVNGEVNYKTYSKYRG